MLGVGGSFKLLSAVAFFFAWKFYELPVTQCHLNGDSNPDAASQMTIMDGNAPKENNVEETELIPVAQFITVSDSPDERSQSGKEESRITNV